MPRWIRTDAHVASPAKLLAVRGTYFVPRLLQAVCVSLLAVPAFAAPSYHISFERSGYGQQYVITQATPFLHADSYAVPGSVGATFSGSAFSYPGHVGIDNRLEQFWAGPSGAARYDVYSSATADDFVITGPAGPTVAGTLHLRVRGSLSRAGGYVGNGGHGTRLNVDARARFGAFVAMGDIFSTNYDVHGSGVLEGLTSPDLDFPFVLTGMFPVGTAFDVYIRVFGIETTYGNGGSSPNPGWARTDAATSPSYGLFLEEVSGQVMALPAGYTLNSSSWGVADNHFTSIVGVGPAPGRDALGLSAHPNPFTSASTVSFEQPHAGHVRLQVFDLGGRLVRTLADGWHAAGIQRFPWDGRCDDGSVVESGLYFARVESNGRIASQRIVRMR